MENNDFNEKIFLTESVHVSSTKLFNLRSFYHDLNLNPSLWGCKALRELISLIPEDCAINESDCELYLPVNKKTMPVEILLPFIKEQIIDLNTYEGKKEAGRRLAILAHLLSLQPHGEVNKDGGLDPCGGGTIIGDFLFPDGKICYIITFFKTTLGQHSNWWFNCIDNNRFNVTPNAWFAFSSELQKLVNSNSQIN